MAEARRKSNGEALSESDRLKTKQDAVSDGEREVLDFLCKRVKPKENGDGELAGDQEEAGQ